MFHVVPTQLITSDTDESKLLIACVSRALLSQSQKAPGPIRGNTVKFDEPSRVEEVSMTVHVAHADV